MKLITFSGTDGSGKTTQFKKLYQHLTERDKKVFHFHGVSFSVANVLNPEPSSPKKKSTPKAKTEAGRLAIFLRKIALIIDVLRFKRLYKNLRKQKTDYVLADRYFFDQLVNITYLEKKEKLPLSSWWWCTAKKWLFWPNLSVFIQTPPKTAINRSREIEQGIEYLEKKFKLYQELAKKFNFIIIDGKKEKDIVFKEIKRLV